MKHPAPCSPDRSFGSITSSRSFAWGGSGFPGAPVPAPDPFDVPPGYEVVEVGPVKAAGFGGGEITATAYKTRRTGSGTAP